MFNPADALRDNPTLFACYILFIYFRGKNAVRIEREMRELGYTTFHRRNLYPRGTQPGWIAKHNWQSQKDEGERIKDKAEPSDPSSSFADWLKRVSPTMTWDWKHQQVIIEQLKKVTSGDCKRLMIFLPPRHGKTELVSVRYTAWRMQQRPEMNVILGSYNQRLADRMSRKIRTAICDAEAIRLGKGGNTSGSECAPPIIKPQMNADKRRSEKAAADKDIGVHPRQSAVNSFDDGSPFPFSRPRQKNAVSEWETAAGGSFRAVGTGSGVTGFGANLIVIDDPVKNRAQAESETFRNRVWDWYKDDLYTRLEPDGSIVLIQTRWHEDDLAGRLLRDNLDDWTVINLPALSEPGAIATGSLSEPPASAGGQIADQEEPQMDADQRGSDLGSASVPSESSALPATLTTDFTEQTENTEKDISVHPRSSAVNTFEWRQTPNIALCPQRFDVPALEQQRTQLGTYAFSALYQQRPTPAGGNIFKREWFKQIIDFAPPGLKWTRGYDLAVSTSTESDYTASFRVAFDDKSGTMYISGGFRRRIEFPDQRRYIIDRMLNERDTQHGVELALHGQALLQDLRRDPKLRGKILRGVKVSTDKLTRALTWAPTAEEGKVILIRNADFGMRNEMHKPVRQQGRPQNLNALHDPCDTEISPRRSGRHRNPPEASDEIPHSEFPIPHSPWIEDLLDELSAFPNGTHDDQIDAISIAVQLHAHKPRTGGGLLIV
jgi:phage terminase large subunit-like protein